MVKRPNSSVAVFATSAPLRMMAISTFDSAAPDVLSVTRPVTSVEATRRATDAPAVGAALAVAENGAVWLTEQEYGVRALPFICQHLVVVLQKQNIVHNMHEAYKMIRNEHYGFGVFIAGPSKTADIEQSLVLGAHGPYRVHVIVVTTA